MHDLRWLRTHQAEAEAGFRKKRASVDFDAFFKIEEQRLGYLAEVEELKRLRNVGSEEIGHRKQKGEDASGRVAETKKVSELIKEKERLLDHLESRVHEMVRWMPNLPHADVPDGDSAADNIEVARWGTPRPAGGLRPHWEVAERLGLIDFARGTKIAGSGFPLFMGDGARLVRALVQFMIDLHTRRHGYTLVQAPIVVRSAALEGTGQLPKMADDMYRIQDEDLWLNPTAEVPVTNIFRDEVLEPGTVPANLVCYSPSFRREAGAYGKDTRGIVRLHQFDKVELVKFVDPTGADAAHEQLRSDVESVFQALGIPYRVLSLCGADLSFAAAKCYDMEVWAAGEEGRWLEASSCSNFDSFQARRAGIRFRRDAKAKPEFVATLNASGVAIPRTLVALLENGQQEDGSVVLPDVLAPYLGGQTTLRPASGA
jgi:seryl-tRNA synthetase